MNIGESYGNVANTLAAPQQGHARLERVIQAMDARLSDIQLRVDGLSQQLAAVEQHMSGDRGLLSRVMALERAKVQQGDGLSQQLAAIEQHLDGARGLLSRVTALEQTDSHPRARLPLSSDKSREAKGIPTRGST